MDENTTLKLQVAELKDLNDRMTQNHYKQLTRSYAYNVLIMSVS